MLKSLQNIDLYMTQEFDIKRKAELIKQICRGQTTVSEAVRHYDLNQHEVEKWMGDAEAGMENAIRFAL